jgi:hypothetical protein
MSCCKRVCEMFWIWTAVVVLLSYCFPSQASANDTSSRCVADILVLPTRWLSASRAPSHNKFCCNAALPKTSNLRKIFAVRYAVFFSLFHLNTTTTTTNNNRVVVSITSSNNYSAPVVWTRHSLRCVVGDLQIRDEKDEVFFTETDSFTLQKHVHLRRMVDAQAFCRRSTSFVRERAREVCLAFSTTNLENFLKLVKSATDSTGQLLHFSLQEALLFKTFVDSKLLPFISRQ